MQHRLLDENDRVAANSRFWLGERGIVALNVMGAPGAGKTQLLERTVRELGPSVPVSVLEGDQQTDRDAQRIRAAGAPVTQLTTGSGCHLNATMVANGLRDLEPREGSLLFVENVGNLVCPALFDIGEAVRVVVMSVTEGDDKPLKYPHIFRTADVLVLNKSDLLEHVPFDVERCLTEARRVAPPLRTFELSALTGDGMQPWLDWLQSLVRAPRQSTATRTRP
ncbi:MAG: hydrogenase nickel incorporation protein HypB [Polyangiales bacterium]